MVHRRVGKSARFAKKKKLKFSDRLLNPSLASAIEKMDIQPQDQRTNAKSRRKNKDAKKAAPKTKKGALLSAAKQRSILLRRQAAERMALKEHVAQLEERRRHIRKGEDAKLQRRELGKYIRQLMQEQEAKHQAELQAVEVQRSAADKSAALDSTVPEALSEADLKSMFAHLLA
jgi:hypothetical protein